MALLDPVERTARGVSTQSDRLAAPAPEPTTPYEASLRDFVFAEVWTRPGLALRYRYLISMASACNTNNEAMATAYARGALKGGDLTLAELREAALHTAVYCGWSSGQRFDAAVTAAAGELGLAPADFPAIRAEPWDATERLETGVQNFTDVMTFGGPPVAANAAFFEGGINNFVFGEMWRRPGLDERSRRFITLVGVCDSAAYTPIQSHIYAAMKSGNATPQEMEEFVLQYAIHAGWPRASVAQSALMAQAPQVAKGLAFSFGQKEEGK